MYNQLGEEMTPLASGLFMYVLSDASYTESPAVMCKMWLMNNEEGMYFKPLI